MTDDEIKNWLSLKLLKKRNKNSAYNSIDGTGQLFSQSDLQKKLSQKDKEWITTELDLLKKHGATIVPIESNEYPECLKHIHNPPVFLYVLGTLPSPELTHIAVVGTRLASHYGLSMSEKISQKIASSSTVIVSGLARGCDTYAHRGALKSKGLTVAVLGTGLDRVYPKENEKLFNEIKDSGAIVTEFPFGTPPLPGNFPARNRIISGLSRGVVVVEAPVKSGAMMTARMALDEGRDVFSVPGKTTSDKSSGTNKLIKDGAMLVDSGDDILNFYGLSVETNITISDKNSKVFTKEEKQILEILSDESIHIDSIKKESNFTIQKLSFILLDMELKGLIKQLAGKHYIKE